MLHDLGKAADEFQAYIRRENHIDDDQYDVSASGRVNHSSAGAALAEKMRSPQGHPIGRILAYVIAGHHAGLPDFDVADGGNGALQVRLEEGRADLTRISGAVKVLANAQLAIPTLPFIVRKENAHLWIRMLFSCLVDADFLDTESFMDQEWSSQRQATCDLANLKNALDRHMADLTANCDRNPVNATRREILELCRNAASGGPGLYSLTVPTGGGKTLAAMTFALDHAIKHDKRRVIYVIPYTSIIEQTASILASILGPENVIEHHSNLDPDRMTPRTQLAAENWDAPVVITTNVQLFESLYSARPGRCRKLHNIIDSVVILDEAQLIPPRWLAPCVSAINDLCRSYGVTVLLSTATQPSLPQLDPPKEIVPDIHNLYRRLRRTHVHFPRTLETRQTWEVIASRLTAHRQVLCIVNTRKDCYELFKLMPEGTIHLSALMCGQHRAAVIRSIKERLSKGDPVRVISTQLVEAGVDIDFPVVFRALSGLDSIVQAAGRCNREGKLKVELGEVIVFVPPRPSPIGLLRKGEDRTREIHSLPDFDPQDPQWFTRYFDTFYDSVNDTGENFLKLLVSPDTADLKFAFRTAGEMFRLIDEQDRQPVLVQYGRGKKLINELRREGPHRNLLRKLQRYTVNLYRGQAEKLRGNGLLEDVPSGFVTHCLPSTYNDITGLDVWGEQYSSDEMIGV